MRCASAGEVTRLQAHLYRLAEAKQTASGCYLKYTEIYQVKWTIKREKGIGVRNEYLYYYLEDNAAYRQDTSKVRNARAGSYRK